MANLWLVSVPAQSDRKKAWEKLTNSTVGRGLADVFEFKVPLKSMKVGTLDSLMTLSDEIAKVDAFVETTLKKCEKTLVDMVDGASNLFFVENSKTTPLAYVQRFEWKEERYASSLPLKELSSRLFREVQLVDDNLKQKVSRFYEVKSNLAAMDKKESNSLALRSLNGIVKPAVLTFSPEKEFPMFTALLLVIPKNRENEFLASYETLDVLYNQEHKENDAVVSSTKIPPSVVPRSALKVFEDEESALYRVFVLIKGEEVFKAACKEKRFHVRTVTYDDDSKERKEKKENLESDKNSQQQNLVNWLKASYSDLFISWLHVKCIRVFCESVLRFGLPVSFLAAFISPKTGSEKSIRKALAELYGHLGSNGLASAADDEVDDSADFYPYVSLNLEFGSSDKE